MTKRGLVGVLTSPAALLRNVDGREQLVLGLAPWRLGEGPVRWEELRVECQPLSEAECRSVKAARLYSTGLVICCAPAPPVDPQFDLRGVDVSTIDLVALSAAEAGFPSEPPPLIDLPSVLRDAYFMPGYVTLTGMVVVGGIDVEAFFDIDGSTEKVAVRKKVAKYVTRLEDVIARWTTIEQEVRGRAASIPPEGPKPSDWKLASVMLDGRRTTLMFEDAANEDAEHGLEAKLDTKGKLVSVDRP